MKLSIKPAVLPWFPLLAGGIGMALRFWLFSLKDAKGLLPAGHAANVICYILLALVLAGVYLASGKLPALKKYRQMFPGSILRAVGCWLGAVGCLCNLGGDATGAFRFICLFLGILSAFMFCVLGYCRLRQIRPTALLYAIITVYLMFYGVTQVRAWSNESQLTVYLFPLLAIIFLMLTAFTHACLAIREGTRRNFVFYNQCALFCCCLAVPGEKAVFFLCMGAWLALDLCALRTPRSRAQLEESL